MRKGESNRAIFHQPFLVASQWADAEQMPVDVRTIHTMRLKKTTTTELSKRMNNWSPAIDKNYNDWYHTKLKQVKK